MDFDDKAYKQETDEWLKSKTIAKADVKGDGITLVFSDGSRFEYESDEYNSCWGFYEK